MTTTRVSSRLLFVGLFLLTVFSAACNTNQPKDQVASPTQPAKRYHLKGKVVSIDQPGKMANVDSEAIPDFMGAMTMPYEIKPEGDLEKLKAGDAITADVVVQDDKYWLENVVVTGKSPGSKQ